MSDKWLKIQHEEVKARARDQRLADQREAQRQAEARNKARGR